MLKRNCPDVYNEIISFINNNPILAALSFKQKIWHFINNVSKISVYVNRRWNQNYFYENLGFKPINIEKPDYFYVFKGFRKNKSYFIKRKLVEQGYDPNKSEHEIMLERKIHRIYDSGNIWYEYTLNCKC